MVILLVITAVPPLADHLPLGGDTARAVGMALTPTRIALLLLAACLTATATMTIGPLSFVGLMAPHIARMMGFRRTMPHIVISALVGGLLLVFADWCGRMVLFPFQIPAGLLSTFIGAPYFIYLLKAEPLIECLARWARQNHHNFANTRRAASMVLLISSMLCATDIKPASNADGAR